MEYILIFITAIFVNNIVLSQFLGICPFLGVSKKVETAMGMGAAVAFVLTLATIVTYVIQKFVLDAFGLGYLQTIAFILVIAALVQMVEIILKKVSPALYQALGVFLPLITTNCCILGVTILVIQKNYDLLTGVVYAFSTALGFALSDGVIALPGGCGTLEELLEIITWKQLGLYLNPIIILNINGFYDSLLEMLQRAVDENFMRKEHAAIWKVASTAEEAINLLYTTPVWSKEIRKFAAI